jgi:hypothetical protein
MIVTVAHLCGFDPRFAKAGWNRMNNDVETGRKFLQTLPHRFAADQSRIAQPRNVASDLFLQWVNPKLTLPRWATGKKFVKDYEETATTALAKGTPDRQRRKRQPTFLITVVDVMQDHASGFVARHATLGHRRYFESFFF